MHGAPAYGGIFYPTRCQDEAASKPRQGPEGILRRCSWSKWSAGGPVPESLGSLGGPGGREAVQEDQRNRTKTCAKRYAQYGLADMRFQKQGTCNIFLTCKKEAEIASEMGGAKRYADCHFVDMSDLKRFVLGMVRYVFCKFAKPKSIGANIKSLKNHCKNLSKLNP